MIAPEMIDVASIHAGARLRLPTLDAIAVIANSIREIGLQTPLIVRNAPSLTLPNGQTIHEVPVLIAGATRLEAAKSLGWDKIAVTYVDCDDIDARRMEIAENLHRSELTVLERATHTAEWIRLTEAKQAKAKATADLPLAPESQSAQLGQIEKPKSKRSDGKGHRSQGGIAAASRDIDVTRQEADRSIKIDSIDSEVKQAATDAGLADNQSALLKIAAEPTPEKQAAKVKEIAEKKAKKKSAPKPPRPDASKKPKSTPPECSERAIEFADIIIGDRPTNEILQLITLLEEVSVSEIVAGIRVIHERRKNAELLALRNGSRTDAVLH